jgi:drug/metabolite transporter superfamily protein YnfA
MYLALITLNLCLVYTVLYFLYPFFFENKVVKMRYQSLFSIGLIFTLSITSYLISFTFQDPEFSNRLLHAFGGGFMAFLVSFLAAKDSKLSVGKFQFFIFSVLMVSTLGVANELLEFILQNYVGMQFSTSINDTWLDLVSNTIGIAAASIILTPFIKK